MLARMFGVSALQAQGVIIGWQIYALTKDPLLLGLTGLAEALPALSCALFAGNIVDHTRPQRIGMACFGALLVNTCVLFLIGSEIIPLRVHHFLPIAYTAIFISGAVRSFIMPASFSLLAQIAARKDIPSATAWMSNGFQVASIVVPALTGVIYGWVGPKVAWAIPVTMMAGAFTMMSLIPPGPKRKVAEVREPMIDSMRAGWKFILSTPVLLGAMALDMVAVLFGGAVALLPAFSADVLHAGSQGLGILRSAPAVGAILMGLFLATRPMKRISVARLLWVVGGFGLSMIGFGLSRNIALSILFLALSGVFDSVSVVIRQTLMQLLTPPEMRGRVSSVSSMFVVSSNELGALESGVLAKLIGLTPAVIVGGAGSIIVAGLAAVFSPAIRDTVIETEAPLANPVPAPNLQVPHAEETAIRGEV